VKFRSVGDWEPVLAPTASLNSRKLEAFMASSAGKIPARKCLGALI
jgi:hypothetical protein